MIREREGESLEAVKSETMVIMTPGRFALPSWRH